MEILADLRKILGDKWDIMSATKVSDTWIVKARGAGHYEDFAVWDWIPGEVIVRNSYVTSDMAAADQEFQCRVGKGGVSCPSVRVEIPQNYSQASNRSSETPSNQ